MFLPGEILYEIFNHSDASHNDLRTLFSCLLVNRHWCSNVVEILWSKPFYYSNAFVKNPNPHKIIDTYLSCLEEEDREDLRDKGINLPIIYDQPLFSYEKFHKHLYYHTFISCVYLWVQEKEKMIFYYDGHYLFEIIIKILLKLFNEKCNKIQRTLYIIENVKGLITPKSIPMFYVQPEHEYLVSNVNRIWVDLRVPRFFDLLAKNCKRVVCNSLNTCTEQFGVFMGDAGRFNESGSMDVAKFIKEQEALQSFQSIYLTSTQNIIDALETQSKSLKCIDFICANFNGCNDLNGLTNCKNLEFLRFKKCFNITEEMVTPLFITTFPKLIHLSVIKTNCNSLLIWAKNFNNGNTEYNYNYNEDEDEDEEEKENLIIIDNNNFDLNHVRDIMLNNIICYLCNEPCIYPLTITCGHTFCKECILHHLSMFDRCPSEEKCRLTNNFEYFYEHPPKQTDAITLEKRFLEANKRLLQEMPIYVGHLTFPKMTYSFKITEQSHRLLIGSCFESRYRKKFGMILSRRCEYGTLMEIKQIEFNNEGDLIFQAIATDRFKILSSVGIKNGYEIAKVQIIEDGPEEEERMINVKKWNRSSPPSSSSSSSSSSSVIIHEPTTSQLIKMANDFIYGNELVSLMLQIRDLASSLGEIPENAADFSFYVALLLPIKDEEKYELLGKRSTKERMELVVYWIDDLRSQCGRLIRERMKRVLNCYVSWISGFFRSLLPS